MMGPTMGSVTLQEEKGTAELTLHLVRTQQAGTALSQEEGLLQNATMRMP